MTANDDEMVNKNKYYFQNTQVTKKDLKGNDNFGFMTFHERELFKYDVRYMLGITLEIPRLCIVI